jgi:hypothetical protein
MPIEKTCAVRATSRSARFSLAANYDPHLVPALDAYPVDEVYGKFPADGVSGGRPRYLATPLSEADLRRYVHILYRHGIAFNYRTDGGRLRNYLTKRVPLIGARTVGEVASGLLNRHGLSRSDIAWWAVHPGGTVVLAQVAKELKLADESLGFSYHVFENYGNMSSPPFSSSCGNFWTADGRDPAKRGCFSPSGPVSPPSRPSLKLRRNNCGAMGCMR